jgi:hypothetical protein
MFELLLSPRQFAMEEDDHDLPFPAGTPFKGVVRSSDFIDGITLANRINLVEGTPINNNSGWLHFVEDNGYNIYIAKKPLRQQLNWSAINTAQTGKEIVLGGKTFVVEFITGMKTENMSAVPDNAGGAWNKYIYNIYGGERANELPARENWGSYTENMLGLPITNAGATVPGTYSWVKETVANGTAAHATRGVVYPGVTVPNVMGVWYGSENDGINAAHYAWRPMLVEKGTSPPQPVTPFKGEVAQTSLITATDLATAVGLTAGTVTNAGTPWLMIVENGITYYLAKTSMRHTVTKEQLIAANIVNGSKTIQIGGKTYKVRLMTGRDAATSNTVAGEWLHWYTNLTDGTWAFYTTTDLITGTGAANNGQLPLVQENDTRGHAANGYPNLMGAWYQNPNVTNAGYGWRPVLELVP